MESFKEKLPAIIGLLLVILMLGTTYYILVIKTNDYYTQIDNSKIESIESNDGMRYKYKLTSYNKSGKSKEIEFKTTRELKDKAYLKLTYMDVRGVTNWEEVQYDDLPKKVQEHYKK